MFEASKVMESYIVSARKYRPATFEDVVGQSSITGTLQRAIANDHLAQALLFCGPRGVGKTTCARILAKAINHATGTFAEDEDFAFNIFELDAASNNSVDDIRNLIDQVRFAPQQGKFKVYIIDEVHMLSQQAFNAFLKTLEEPPAHAIFILATTEKHKIIPTILSRCQIFDFKRITVGDMVSHLANIAKREGVTIEDEALHVIAEKADGALRDALSIFDRIVTFAGNTVTYKDAVENLNILDHDYYFRATDLVLQGDIPGSMLLFDEVLNSGFNGHEFINGLATHFRNLLMGQDASTIKLLEVTDRVAQRFLVQAKTCAPLNLLKSLRFMNECDVQYRSSKNQRLLVELTLMKMCALHRSPTGEAAEPVAEKKKPQ
jgi:DNA polymerase III subunit gamma/tau